MFRPLELYIGLRYTRAKRRNHFISFISLSSMLGIALGVTALITVISVMNGFEQEVRARILGMASHATLEGWRGRLAGWVDAGEQALKAPHVIGAAPYISQEVMVSRDKQVSGTVLRGVLPEREATVSEVGEKMVAGSMSHLRAGEFGMVMGRELAATLGISLGDKVTVITPQANMTPAGFMPRLKRFTLVGVFEVGMYEYDRGLVLVHMSDAGKLLRMDGAVSGVRLKLDDMFLAPRVARSLAEQLPEAVRVTDWTRRHANYFRAVASEKTVMFVILTLIIAVAAFNIVSTLVMTVTDKQADIAILRTLGSTPGSIMTIFIVQGTVLGLVGTLIGGVGGVALALNVETLVPAIEQALGMEFLPADIYYISDLPSDLQWDDVVKITSISFLLSLVSTIYPAWRASRTQPAEALRYE